VGCGRWPQFGFGVTPVSTTTPSISPPENGFAPHAGCLSSLCWMRSASPCTVSQAQVHPLDLGLSRLELAVLTLQASHCSLCTPFSSSGRFN
jgi:hypothetical protein